MDNKEIFISKNNFKPHIKAINDFDDLIICNYKKAKSKISVKDNGYLIYK